MATSRTEFNVKLLALLQAVVCGYYFVGYLSAPEELLTFSDANRTEAMLRLAFLLGAGLSLIAAPGLYLLKKWAADLALAGAALLTAHLAFVLAESFNISATAELPFAFITFFFWLFLYGADLLGPVTLRLLTRPSVRTLLH
jgi:hypothetical protein